MGKKTWETPKLIRVSRGLPEERVLYGCKSGQIAGPVAVGSGCYCGNTACEPCFQWIDS